MRVALWQQQGLASKYIQYNRMSLPPSMRVYSFKTGPLIEMPYLGCSLLAAVVLSRRRQPTASLAWHAAAYATDRFLKSQCSAVFLCTRAKLLSNNHPNPCSECIISILALGQAVRLSALGHVPWGFGPPGHGEDGISFHSLRMSHGNLVPVPITQRSALVGGKANGA